MFHPTLTGAVVRPNALPLPSRPLSPRERTNQMRAKILEAHGVTLDEFLSSRQTKGAAGARFELCVRLSRLGWTTTQIGRYLGRDHSTVVNALQRVSAPKWVMRFWDVHEDARIVVDITGVDPERVSAIILSETARRNAIRTKVKKLREAFFARMHSPEMADQREVWRREAAMRRAARKKAARLEGRP